MLKIVPASTLITSPPPNLIPQLASVTLRVHSAPCVTPVAVSASADTTSQAGTATVAPRLPSCSAPPAADVSAAEVQCRHVHLQFKCFL